MKTKLSLTALLLLNMLMPENLKAQFTLSCDSFCVTSITMSSIPGNLEVTIFNANVDHINYPTVKVLDANGDTVADDLNMFTFFAQLGNTSQIYLVPTALTALPLNFNGTVLFYDNGWDTVCFLPFPCNTFTSLNEISDNNFSIFPTAGNGMVTLKTDLRIQNAKMELINLNGEIVFETNLNTLNKNELTFDFSNYNKGMYVIRLSVAEKQFITKIIIR